jgi:hypothetical protein
MQDVVKKTKRDESFQYLSVVSKAKQRLYCVLYGHTSMKRQDRAVFIFTFTFYELG